MKLLISLHDVAPFHLPRLLRAEALCREMGLQKLTYLLIPQYHGRLPSDEHADFVAWCREDRPFEVDWHLHGHHHLEAAPAHRRRSNVRERMKRRFLTAGEGEFLALDAAAQRRKLEAGRAVFERCLRRGPDGFVAPAWLFNASLSPLLKDLGFRYTEDHHRVFALEQGRSLRSPVITWATRTVLRKYGSLAVCPLLARLWNTAAVLRVAIHPFDLDHRQTTDSIRNVLGRLLEGREQCFFGDLDFAEPGPGLTPSDFLLLDPWLPC